LNNINESLDQMRWLMNAGLFDERTKDTLFLYGAIAHKDVSQAEVAIDPQTKSVSYTLYAKPRLYKAYNKFMHYKNTKNGIWSLFIQSYLLRVYGNLNIDKLLDSFVKTFCGPAWNATMELKRSSEYVDGFSEKHTSTDRPIIL